MAVKVCDMIMGAGKSQSAITFMNEHPDGHYVYITPYLDEAERIQKHCPLLYFVEPSDKLEACRFSKTLHTAKLLADGRNIATTHSAFKLYTEDMIESIRRWGYTLIIDEAVDILEQTEICAGDLDAMVRGGYVMRLDNGQYERTDVEYTGSLWLEAFYMLERNTLLRTSINEKENAQDNILYWKLSPNIFNSFADVYILTYLFDGTDMDFFLRFHNIPFEYIGVKKIGERYSFSDSGKYYPEYTGRLSELIYIEDHAKANAIGEGRAALSATWYAKAKQESLKKLRDNAYNVLHNLWDCLSSDAMWTTFKSAENRCRVRGYSKGFVQCSCKATNEYKDRTCLAYLINVFENPYKKNYILKTNPSHDETQYALSAMIQWIWRSAIRDGKPIKVYVPSERMRNMLKEWIARVEMEYARYKAEKEQEGVA